MKFVRINEYTVNCILTADDLEEQGIRIEDLLKKEESSMEFLHGIIERATEEVGFHPDGNVLPMQITMLPDDSISLTLTENPSKMIGNFIEGFTGALQKLVSSIEQGKKASESESKEEGNRTAVA
ncbi:MAG: adaptor protein MecA, partial [Lachnospiraceae bacterium]|nr:adaptor protein MecA [Lachnospiraceae bacterium]